MVASSTDEKSKEETKHEKFVRLVNQRAKPAIKYIRMIGKLGTNQYERTKEEIDQIENTLLSEVAKAISNLRRSYENEDLRDIL